MRPSKLNGKPIFSAGEVGAYSVCPESWRLSMLDKVKTSKSDAAVRGHELHREWATKVDESVYLSHRIRFVLGLVIAAVCAYLLLKAKI